MKFFVFSFLFLVTLSANAATEIFIGPGSYMVFKSGTTTACYDQNICREFSLYTAAVCETSPQRQEQGQGGDSRYHSDVAYRRFVTLERMESSRSPIEAHTLKLYESVLVTSVDGDLLVQCR